MEKMMTEMKVKSPRRVAVMLSLAAPLLLASPASAKMSGCSFNGIELKGKVQVVDSFPDIKVQIVKSFPDIKVQKVTSFPSDCGKWQFVDSFPDIKIQYVTSFPDVKVQFVTSFPGVK